MIDDGFFLTVAGIAMSFAGFAGLMNTLRRGGETWSPMDLYQLRIIVAYAIATLFGSLSTIPVRRARPGRCASGTSPLTVHNREKRR